MPGVHKAFAAERKKLVPAEKQRWAFGDMIKKMKILNPKIESDFAERRTIRVDLGCGTSARRGFYAIDQFEMNGVDVVADLNKPLNLFPDNCCEYIYSCHVFEHIKELLPLMREIYRITKPGGTIEIIVPHFSNVYGYSDPTHVRFFGLYSMYYFVSYNNQPNLRKVPAFYTDIRFIIKSLTIEFFRSGIVDKFFSPIFSKFVNHNIYMQDFYERRLASLYHARQIKYLLEPEK